MKGWAPRLGLKKRLKVIRKWPIYHPCLEPAFSVYNMAAEHLNFWHFKTGHCKYLQYWIAWFLPNFVQPPFLIWHIGRADAKENGKTGPRPLRLVGNFLSMPQSPVFSRSISAEGRAEACGLVLRFHGFTAYQCVRADVGSLNQHPWNHHSLRVTAPASLFVNWPFDVGGWGCGGGGETNNFGILLIANARRNTNSEKWESQMGFEPTTFHDLSRRSDHRATGDYV